MTIYYQKEVAYNPQIYSGSPFLNIMSLFVTVV